MKATYIVTGGNSGLGLECVRSLLAGERDAIIVVPCRDKGGFGTAALQQLIDAGTAMRVMRMDLASLQSVRDFVAEFEAAQLPPLKGLVCNAGLVQIQAPSVTADGFETTFGVNHLGHFLLANLMLPLLAPDGNVVFVSSGTHDPATKTGVPEPIYTSAEQIAHNMEPGFRAGQRRYSTSKLLNVYCAYELARRLAASPDARLRSIRVNAVDPGQMAGTNFTRQIHPALRLIIWVIVTLMRRFGVKDNIYTPAVSGARLADIAATGGVSMTNDGAPASGKYFSAGRIRPSSDVSYNEANAAELWATSSKMVGLAT